MQKYAENKKYEKQNAKYAENIQITQKITAKYALNMPRICSKYARNMHEIRKFYTNMQIMQNM